jgi:hypothetical protein
MYLSITCRHARSTDSSPAEHRFAIPVLEHDAAVVRIAQQVGKEAAREFVEVNVALRIHRIKQRIVGIHLGISGKGCAGRDTLDGELCAALELAPEAAAAVLGQAGQILVRAGKAMGT